MITWPDRHPGQTLRYVTAVLDMTAVSVESAVHAVLRRDRCDRRKHCDRRDWVAAGLGALE